MVIVMRSPNWRWGSMSANISTTPNPIVAIVVIARIGRAIDIVVIAIGIGWRCHHGCWRYHSGCDW